MATTLIQDKDFIATVIPSILLEEAIEWISTNLSPEDVFLEDELDTWAIDSGYVKRE